jgi:hypothetical protein
LPGDWHSVEYAVVAHGAGPVGAAWAKGAPAIAMAAPTERTAVLRTVLLNMVYLLVRTVPSSPPRTRPSLVLTPISGRRAAGSQPRVNMS